jgi:hypothetical protein
VSSLQPGADNLYIVEIVDGTNPFGRPSRIAICRAWLQHQHCTVASAGKTGEFSEEAAGSNQYAVPGATHSGS